MHINDSNLQKENMEMNWTELQGFSSPPRAPQVLSAVSSSHNLPEGKFTTYLKQPRTPGVTLPPRWWREQRKERKRGNGLVGLVRRLRGEEDEFLPRTCTGGRRRRTGSDTARLHHTPAPGPLLGTGSLVSEVHCPDTSPDLSCQKNKPTIGLFLTQRRLSVLRWLRSLTNAKAG